MFTFSFLPQKTLEMAGEDFYRPNAHNVEHSTTATNEEPFFDLFKFVYTNNY